jgi:two-component system chemotaxis sensor kinase CheA
MDDETLKMYVEESLEHLADIENDLLAIEEGGADIDEELVNKVFRAAHSIKGGAGFMGLDNIKELSHRMENVLGMIRSREMVPNPEIINILLLASDTLRNLISDVGTSNHVDISEHIDALVTLASTQSLSKKSETEPEIPDTSRKTTISFPDGRPAIAVKGLDVASDRRGGKFTYLVEYDLISDIHQKGKHLPELLEEIEKAGEILEKKIDIDAVGTLDTMVPGQRIPFLVLLKTILEPDMISALLDVDESKVSVISDNMTAKPLGEYITEIQATIENGAEVIAIEFDHRLCKFLSRSRKVRRILLL